MDVGVYVTSLRVLKNLLLVGDAVKSIMFVAFQVWFCSFLSAICHG
jgi:cleavage and polyadenylation specificity factor subunit 1